MSESGRDEFAERRAALLRDCLPTPAELEAGREALGLPF